MVAKIVYIICSLILWPFILMAQETAVEASIEPASSFEDRPLKGLITITHHKRDKVDSDSIRLDQQPLKVDFVQKIPMSSGSQDIEVSVYHFTLPPQPKGLYILPSLTVKVGSQTVQTTPSTYEVRSHTETKPIQAPTPQKRSTQRPQRRSPSSSSPTIFRLEAKIDGPSTLYPGQRTKLAYRILYNRSIDLTASFLPFIHPSQFKKIGDVHIQDSQQGNLTIQDIVQEVEAVKAGAFQFGPSKIAGYAYQLNLFGEKVYQPPLLQAQAPAREITVKAFPLKDQPASFNGALGRLQVDVEMTTPKKRRLGDKIDLKITVAGIENLEDMRLPDFHCQPGWSGFFQFSDLPPSGKVQEETKQFLFTLRPISLFAQAIPPFEVSSFDPQTDGYVAQRTKPIPLEISALPLLTSPPSSLALPADRSLSDKLWNAASWPLPPLEIEALSVSPDSLKTPWTQTPWVLWIIPLGCAYLMGLNRWHSYLLQHPRPTPKQSEIFFKRAFSSKRLSVKQIAQLLEKAYWWKMWEAGWIPPQQNTLESLPKQGRFHDIRQFLFHLQALQYSPKQVDSLANLLGQAKQLFNTIS